MDLTDIAIQGTISIGSIVAVGKFILQRFERWQDNVNSRQDRTESRLKDMEDRRVSVIETNCIRHKAEQQAERHQAEIKNLEGWMKKNDLILGQIRDGVASLQATSEADRRWITNINDSHRQHVNDHTIHGVHNNG